MQTYGMGRKVCYCAVLAVTLMMIIVICRKSGTLAVKAAGNGSSGQVNIQNNPEITSGIGQKNYAFQPGGVTPDAALYYGETALVEGKDYTVKYTDNLSVGTATAIVTGTGKYSGQISLKYEIVAAELKAGNIILDPSVIEYNGASLTFADLKATLFYVADGRKPFHPLVEGKDFKIVGYGENVNPGTAKMTVGGLGNYTGIATATYTIYTENDVADQDNMKTDIKDAKITFSNVQSYTGEPVTPKLTVVCEGKELDQDFDYTVEYSNNIEPGTATITIRGTGSYDGEKSVTFEIVEG